MLIKAAFNQGEMKFTDHDEYDYFWLINTIGREAACQVSFLRID